MDIAPGQLAPDADVYRADGVKVALRTYWNTRPVVLTFLRHFGCQFCREFLFQLRTAYPDFVERRAAVIAVAHGSVPQTTFFTNSFRIPFPILTDPSRHTHQLFGLGEQDKPVDMNVATRMMGAALKGNLPGVREHFDLVRKQDWGGLKQLGGTFVIAPGGQIHYAHMAMPIYTHPTVAELLDVLDTMAARHEQAAPAS